MALPVSQIPRSGPLHHECGGKRALQEACDGYRACLGSGVLQLVLEQLLVARHLLADLGADDEGQQERVAKLILPQVPK